MLTESVIGWRYRFHKKVRNSGSSRGLGNGNQSFTPSSDTPLPFLFVPFSFATVHCSSSFVPQVFGLQSSLVKPAPPPSSPSRASLVMRFLKGPAPPRWRGAPLWSEVTGGGAALLPLVLQSLLLPPQAASSYKILSVLLGSGCGGLNCKLSFVQVLEAEKVKIKVPTDADENLLPGSQTAVFGAVSSPTD